MAKRPGDDDEDEPIVRKRRYNPSKKEGSDDEDAPGPRRKGAPVEEEDDDEEEGNISTGNVYLDITLDFYDDCIEWSKGHILYAVITGVAAFLVLMALSYFFINSCVRYVNRPTLATVMKVYDQGLFSESKLLADYALQYVSPKNFETRAQFLFLQGAALCAIAERVASAADQRDYYLTAANYLKESAEYGFLPERVAEGWFFLGQSLYHCGKLEQCRIPLEMALEKGCTHTKKVYWYLSNAYLMGLSPDLSRSRQYLIRFQEEPSALEEEIVESYLLETIIDLHSAGLTVANKTFAKVPQFTQFAVLHNFVKGQLKFFKARELRQQAIEIETAPNPGTLLKPSNAVVPAPVGPEALPVPTNASPPVVVPVAPVPVLPTDESTLREFMLPNPMPNNMPTPVVGLFDSDSEIQRRLAQIRLRYADNASEEDEIIVLSEEEYGKTAPVPPPKPPEIITDLFAGDPVLIRAKKLRDESADLYQQAIVLFTEVVNLADADNPWGRNARLLIGICYTEKGEPKKADSYYHSLIEAFPASQEAAVASFMLGEYDQIQGNAEAALRSFAFTFDNLRRNPDFVSFWMPKTMIVQRCEDMVRSDIEKQNYANAINILDILNGVMIPAEIARLKGEAYEHWANLLQSQAETTFGERGNQLAKEAESKRRSAGAAFAARAQLLPDTLEFSNLLWRAAENYRIGKDHRRGAIEYKKFMSANLVDRRPEVNLRLGEMYLHLDMLDEAADVLEEGLHDFPSHNLAPQFRLVLSYVYGEQKEWDKAVAALKLNLIGEASPASDTYRDSMYELGRISFERGKWDAAIPYLEDAIKIHPNALQAAEANYTLARAYLRQADTHLGELEETLPESVRQFIESIVQTNRQQALRYLERAEYLLSDRQRALGLTEYESRMLRNTHFTTCSILIKMERYEQVIPKLNTLATMYHDKPAALDALLQMAYVLRMTGRETESQTALRRAEVILNQFEKTGTIADGTDWRNKIQSQMKR